jgi:hypothetical protein
MGHRREQLDFEESEQVLDRNVEWQLFLCLELACQTVTCKKSTSRLFTGKFQKMHNERKLLVLKVML